MPYKTIIAWTFKAGGGTNIGTSLARLSSHSSIKHHILNPDRPCGTISKEWNAFYDAQKVHRSISGALDLRPNLKHCFKGFLIAIDVELLQKRLQCACDHIVLCCHGEVNRLFPLAIAVISGPWSHTEAQRMFCEDRNGDRILPFFRIQEALNQMSDCQNLTDRLVNTLNQSGDQHSSLYFKGAYEEPTLGKPEIIVMLKEICHTEDRIELLNSNIEKPVKNAGKKNDEMASFVPNIRSWRNAPDRIRSILRAAATGRPVSAIK